MEWAVLLLTSLRSTPVALLARKVSWVGSPRWPDSCLAIGMVCQLRCLVHPPHGLSSSSGLDWFPYGMFSGPHVKRVMTESVKLLKPSHRSCAVSLLLHELIQVGCITSPDSRNGETIFILNGRGCKIL